MRVICSAALRAKHSANSSGPERDRGGGERAGRKYKPHRSPRSSGIFQKGSRHLVGTLCFVGGKDRKLGRFVGVSSAGLGWT